MTHYYKHNGFSKPGVTSIISDSMDKPQLVQWAANMAVEYIKDNCCITREHESYLVSDEDLANARFHYKTVSKTALDVGSETHQAIEELFNEILRET